MREVFISYRRDDSEFPGDRLREDLVRAFGDGSVFMDRHPGGIPWGADWEQELKAALDGCCVLLALIGRKWLSCRRPPGGPRRIDLPDDWVRGEILHTLRRHIPVFPVFVDGATAPDAAQLPDELRAARFQFDQGYPMSQQHWEADLARLVAALLPQPRLRELHAAATAPTGVKLLQYVATGNTPAAAAVWRSRQVFEQTDSDFRQLERFKCIHDELHAIEVDVLIPLQLGSDVTPETACRDFAPCADEIRRYLHAAGAEGELPPLLRGPGGLPAALDSATDALTAAEAAPDETTRQLALSRLQRLVGHMEGVERLMEGVATAAKLATLVRELNALRKALPSGEALEKDPELKPLLQRIRLLAQLQIELKHRLDEHASLQELDMALRRLCEGHLARGEPDAAEWPLLQADWSEIRGRRATLESPVSLALRTEFARLLADQARIDESMASGDRGDLVKRLRSFFRSETRAFRRVDAELKRFLSSLTEVTLPMRTVLDMCKAGGRHG